MTTPYVEPLPEGLSKLSILIVDDDPQTLEMAVAALGSLGIERTITATEGEQALGLITPEIDVVLCDLNMPGMDGLSLIGELAKSTFAGGLILISGESAALLRTAGEYVRVHSLTLLGTASKPLSAAQLAVLLARYSRATGATSESGTEQPSPAPLDAATLADALDAGSLRLCYQPQVRMADGKVCGLEALVRILDSDGEIMMPADFISIAEDSGLITRVTEQVLALTVQDAPALIAAGGPDLTISVNVSAECLRRPSLPDEFEAAVRGAGLTPSQLIVEVTESRLIEDLATSLEVLSRLRLKGFGLSIDDFGTGFAGMKQLRLIPVAELKIDRVFVQAATDDFAAAAIIEASIDLARKLDLTVVAEGVETPAEWNSMRELGVDVVQGYLVARPMSLTDAVDWLRDWDPESLVRAPVLDTAPLQRIIGSDPRRVASFLSRFLDQARDGERELAAAGEADDHTPLVQTSHRLKSTARGVGAMALGDVCAAIERAGKQQETDRYGNLLDAYRQALADLIRAVEAEFPPRPNPVEGG